jgi:hypothetical protein
MIKRIHKNVVIKKIINENAVILKRINENAVTLYYKVLFQDK